MSKKPLHVLVVGRDEKQTSEFIRSMSSSANTYEIVKDINVIKEAQVDKVSLICLPGHEYGKVGSHPDFKKEFEQWSSWRAEQAKQQALSVKSRYHSGNGS